MRPLSDKQRELLQAILDGKELEFRRVANSYSPSTATTAENLIARVLGSSTLYRVKPAPVVPKVMSQQYHDWHGGVRTWRSDEMARELVNGAIWFRSWISYPRGLA
jgi:hypothetical protein